MNYNLLRGKIVEKGLTQACLAERIGISKNSMSRKLLGKRDFKLFEVSKICNVLDINNPEDIFFDNIIPKMQQNDDDTKD